MENISIPTWVANPSNGVVLVVNKIGFTDYLFIVSIFIGLMPNIIIFYDYVLEGAPPTLTFERLKVVKPALAQVVRG